MGRHHKITWDVIYQDFRDNHPKLAKKAIHYEPYNYAMILIKSYDKGECVRMTYNYDTKELLVLK